jgi:hypothetical protein
MDNEFTEFPEYTVILVSMSHWDGIEQAYIKVVDGDWIRWFEANTECFVEEKDMPGWFDSWRVLSKPNSK